MRLTIGWLILLSASLLMADKVKFKTPGLNSKHAEAVGSRSANVCAETLASSTRATANELSKIESQRVTGAQGQQHKATTAPPKIASPAQNKNKPIRAVYKPPQSSYQAGRNSRPSR